MPYRIFTVIAGVFDMYLLMCLFASLIGLRGILGVDDTGMRSRFNPSSELALYEVKGEVGIRGVEMIRATPHI